MSNKIICIEREYGSNGRNIGEWLAKQSGIVCYNHRTVMEEAKKRGLADTLEGLDEEEEFNLLTRMVKLLAKERSCVFIGCLASQALSDYPRKLTVFIYADMESRIKWVTESEHISREEAIKLIEVKGKQRVNYHNSYSDTKLGELSSYDLAVSSSRFGISDTADLIHTCMSKI